MTLTSASGNGSSILTPEEVQALVVQPLQRESVAMQVSTVVMISEHETRFPIVNTDVTAGWTAEGAEINVTDPDLDELVCTPKKLASLTVVSNELLADSNPNAATVVGESIVRDLAKKVDAAFFGTTVSNGPSGLESLASNQDVNGGGSFANLDAFAEAISLLDQVDSSLDRSFVMNPSTLLDLHQIKVGTDFNQPLLGVDPSSPTKRSILGVPTFWSPYIQDGRVWLIAKGKSYVVVRQDTDVRTDTSAYFSSDRTGVRATMRCSFAWPHPAAVVSIGLGGS